MDTFKERFKHWWSHEPDPITYHRARLILGLVLISFCLAGAFAVGAAIWTEIIRLAVNYSLAPPNEGIKDVAASLVKLPIFFFILWWWSWILVEVSVVIVKSAYKNRQVF